MRDEIKIIIGKEIEMKSIKKNRKVILCVFVLMLLTGTVTAIIFSNTLTGTIELKGQYPFRLSWINEGIYSTNYFSYSESLTDTLILENLDTVESYTVDLCFLIENAVALQLGDVLISINSEDLPLSVIGGKLSGLAHKGVCPPAYLSEMVVSISFASECPLGTYIISIWIDSVA